MGSAGPPPGPTWALSGTVRAEHVHRLRCSVPKTRGICFAGSSSLPPKSVFRNGAVPFLTALVMSWSSVGPIPASPQMAVLSD